MALTAAAKLETTPNSQTRRVLFARLGSMTYYAGPQEGDEKPKGGFSFSKEHVGHEVFNFANFKGRVYGYVPVKKKKSINLKRIDPLAGHGDALDDVLVIFIAGQAVIGWYDGASVYREAKDYPTAVSKDIEKRLSLFGTKNFKFVGYNFEVAIEKAILIPTHERVFVVPGPVKGGFGMSNVCYRYQQDGKLKAGSWMDDAISYVLNYDKANLLTDPTAEKESDESLAVLQEQAAGFQSNPKIRHAIEEYSMKKARSLLVARGYTNIVDTSRTKPYDYTSKKNGTGFFVEVKGTQTLGNAIILTRGEVQNVRENPEKCILILVHSVNVSGVKNIKVSGGTTKVRDNWKLSPEDLTPIQYVWEVT
jgi:Domain of unknown function (DUF3883)